MTTSIDLDAALNDVLEHEYDQPDGQPAAADDQEPYIAALPIDALFADYTYQRALDEFRVNKMAANYKLALVGIVEVSDRGDGRYAILDGQHRWATVRNRAFDQVAAPHLPCRVHTGLTVDQEARLYHELNTTRKQLTGWDRWLARRGAGDPVVRDIEEVLERHGLTVAIREGADFFRATRSAEKIVELGGLPLLDTVVGISRAIWPADQSALDGDLLHGLAHVVLAYDIQHELDLARLTQALAIVMPRQVGARASAARELHKGTKDRLVGHVVIETYNGTKGPRVEPFMARVRPVTKPKNTVAERNRKALNDKIRAWAVEQGLMQPGKAAGRIRKNVREAYDAAHQQAGVQ
jgi:hypothetical protein